MFTLTKNVFGFFLAGGAELSYGVWFVSCSGTPIQNSVKDLWSLISFLKLKPFSDQEWWRRTIQRPVVLGAPGGLGYGASRAFGRARPAPLAHRGELVLRVRIGMHVVSS